jgi:predicted transcriptional regulator
VWLRALEIASMVVDSKDFDEMVICAGGIRLVDQLLDRLDDLSENLQKDESIEMARRQLGRVSRIWKAEKVLGGRVFTNDEVKETHDRVTNVLQMFLSQR